MADSKAKSKPKDQSSSLIPPELVGKHLSNEELTALLKKQREQNQ